MKIISIFNNKGGVGKSTLSFHLAHALAEKGKKTLMIDLDPQSNLTVQCMDEETLANIWTEEEPFIEDFQDAQKNSKNSLEEFFSTPRSIHCILKPIEDGVFDSFTLGTIKELSPNLGIIPGRLSLHMFEDKLAKSWGDAFLGEPQALRLLTAIRTLCLEAQTQYGYEIAILDTSPSLGVLNRIVISMSTGFFVPCMPDMFSTFGLTNIGLSLKSWHQQFSTMYSVLSDKKRNAFPKHFVKFLGYTIYNAKKYSQKKSDLGLATAHLGYAKKIPSVISERIPKECYSHLDEDTISKPIGGTSIMHSHNTLPSMAQKYHQPMWEIPSLTNLAHDDRGTIQGNRRVYEDTRQSYSEFAEDLMNRLKNLED